MKNPTPGENFKQKSKEVSDLMQFIYEYGLKANCSKVRQSCLYKMKAKNIRQETAKDKENHIRLFLQNLLHGFFCWSPLAFCKEKGHIAGVDNV